MREPLLNSSSKALSTATLHMGHVACCNACGKSGMSVDLIAGAIFSGEHGVESSCRVLGTEDGPLEIDDLAVGEDAVAEEGAASSSIPIPSLSATLATASCIALGLGIL